MKSATILSIALGAALVLGVAVFLATRRGTAPIPMASDQAMVGTASDVPGQTGIEQVIEITAKGGYTPLVLKIKTDGTFDCSAALRIASLGWSQNLSPTGEVAIQVPAQKAGATLVGVCSMGMYNFKITFE